MAGRAAHAPGRSAVAEGTGLLHDAQNLLGALGLYCDLLSTPGVLKPEHRHYAEELRLVGSRSTALVERLLLSARAADEADDRTNSGTPAPYTISAAAAAVSPSRAGSAADRVLPISLRTIVERCSGVLSQVAGGRTIEVSFGGAAAMPVRVTEEAVERILVNLVRNAALALEDRESRAGSPQGAPTRVPAPVVVREEMDGTEDERVHAIRIGVGRLANRVGDPRPWPFRSVRLTVEDSGCGMTPARLQEVLRVVRELVAASQGEMHMMSAPGIGTLLQIDWPVAVLLPREGTEQPDRPHALERRASQASSARPAEAREGVSPKAAGAAAPQGKIQAGAKGLPCAGEGRSMPC
jgi:signal transduction histidine kinase